MEWRGSQADSRNRYLAKFNATEADRYDAAVGELSRVDEDAYLADLLLVVQFRPGMAILDAGAGTGALCRILTRLPNPSITALEPAPAMLARLVGKAELRGVVAVEGFCDGIDDRHHFQEAQFDAVVSRQLVNGLFDPLTAFRNWHHWLSPGGSVVAIDGLYDRSAWTGVWQEEVDTLPLSACQSTASAPYLLEFAGFRIEAVQFMESVNAMPSTKTPRFVVVARKAKR